MCDKAIVNKAFALIAALALQNSDVDTSDISVPESSFTESISENIIKAENLQVSTVSVSCLKAEWDSIPDRVYYVTCEVLDENYQYMNNVYFEFKSNNLCYITGLRENTEYRITVKPESLENEISESVSAVCSTEKVEVIEEFEHEDGWTNCFCYERASGLTRNPSWSAIQGASPDKVTKTGIMRDDYGDYCCAMGVYYGYCGDRFLVELDNGTQFTVKICDSKGYADDGSGKYHWFGGEGNGKCIIEFIYADGYLPSCARKSGNYGYYNWYGMNLCSDIQSIKKINYGETVEY